MKLTFLAKILAKNHIIVKLLLKKLTLLKKLALYNFETSCETVTPDNKFVLQNLQQQQTI